MSKTADNTVKEDKVLEKKVKDFIDHIKNPNTSLTKEKLLELKRKTIDAMSIDRQKLVTKMPFTGGMLMRMNFIPIRDYRCSTAMTDGKNIYVDIDFYKKLSKEERVFILAHECWHNIYLHFMRCQNRNRDLWNIATDCEINYMLKNEGLVPPLDLCFPNGEHGCPPHDYAGKSAEEMYEWLYKRAKKISKNGNKSGKMVMVMVMTRREAPPLTVPTRVPETENFKDSSTSTSPTKKRMMKTKEIVQVD